MSTESDWIDQNVKNLRSLRGRSITGWAGVEMALREVGPDGRPVWHDESVPYLQLHRLDLSLREGEVFTIVTCQNNDQWGLWGDYATAAVDPRGFEAGGIYRARALVELPVGEVDDVRVLAEGTGDIAEILLIVKDRKVSMRPAEVQEELDGSLRIIEMDECVLVQVDGRMPQPILST